MGNLGSIKNMLRKIGEQAEISESPDEIRAAEKLIIPGVGSFDSGMNRLAERGLIPVLNHQVIEEKVPVLGICLGMQLMTRRSEEGSLPGLGWMDAETVRFHFLDGTLPVPKIPHMGWNLVRPVKPSGLFPDAATVHRFYFVHSYHVACRKSEDVLALSCYGGDFVSAFQSGNIAGVQFHPEKSHSFGMRLLKEFCEGC